MNNAGRPDASATRPHDAADEARAGAPDGVLRIRSDQLFAGAREVQILHLGAVYRLKQTALRKLILTK
jgi:hemin uptake protein HemP